MTVAYTVLAVLLAAVLTFSVYGKLTRFPVVVENLDRTGVPHSWYPWLATVEAAGALGLMVGIWIRPLGIAAAIGVGMYFVGAIVTHAVHRDMSGIKSPAPLLVFALAATAFGVMSL